MNELTLDDVRVLGAALGEIAALDAYDAIARPGQHPSPAGDEAWGRVFERVAAIEQRMGKRLDRDIPRYLASHMARRLHLMEHLSRRADMQDRIRPTAPYRADQATYESDHPGMTLVKSA